MKGCACRCAGGACASWSTAKDDLKIIEWIGPKIEQLLHAGGIKTYKQLQNAEVITIKNILDAAGKRYQMHNPTTWPEQAKYVVKGDMAGLKKYQDFLEAGRE